MEENGIFNKNAAERDKNLWVLHNIYIIFVKLLKTIWWFTKPRQVMSLIHSNHLRIRKKPLFFHWLEVCCVYYANLGIWDRKLKYHFPSSLRFDFWLLLCNWLVSLIMQIPSVLKAMHALSHGHMLSTIKCAFVKW